VCRHAAPSMQLPGVCRHAAPTYPTTHMKPSHAHLNRVLLSLHGPLEPNTVLLNGSLEPCSIVPVAVSCPGPLVPVAHDTSSTVSRFSVADRASSSRRPQRGLLSQPRLRPQKAGREGGEGGGGERERERMSGREGGGALPDAATEGGGARESEAALHALLDTYSPCPRSCMAAHPLGGRWRSKRGAFKRK
jgi:hypothetical protein